MHNIWLHRFSILTATSTFLLIFLGGLVTSTGSGLAVPDWPTTYDENMFTYPIDKWIGGIKYEHGHRLFATFVGLLTTILSIWLGISEKRKWVRTAGYLALGMVIFQGLLGGITVLYLLPTTVSIAHGMLAQIFFCLVTAIALVTSPWWINGVPENIPRNSRIIQLSITASSFVFLQLIFGAILRHTYSGLAVPSFPLAFGYLFPPIDSESIMNYNKELLNYGILWKGDKPIEAYQVVIHLIHRYWAYVVSVIVCYTGYSLMRSQVLPEKIIRNGKLMIILVLVQFILGIFTVLSHKEIIITTSHVAVGALTLVICVMTTIQLLKYFTPVEIK